MYNRRNFIKQSTLLGMAAVIPNFLLESFQKEFIEFTKDDLMGKSNVKLYGKGFRLRKDAAEALEALLKKAKKEGFNSYVVSSYRSFNHQKKIWNNKYSKYIAQGIKPTQAIEEIIKYSTIPGTSRHHWGTDFDIIGSAQNLPKDPLNEKHFNKGGQYYEFKQWMNKNANSFGFFEVYTNSKGRKGFEYEPWHFSYAKTSCTMLTEYLRQDIISELHKTDIKGVDYFTQEFLNKYLSENLLDINLNLLP